MEYIYPIMQGQFYSVRSGDGTGYICAMTLTFKDALTKQREAHGGLSLGRVAKGAGVSGDILKNINQGKSERPNADAANRIASYFGVTLTEFLEGVVRPEHGPTAERDLTKLNALVSQLSPDDQARVEAFAEALAQTTANARTE